MATKIREYAPAWRTSYADFRPYVVLSYIQDKENNKTTYVADVYGQILDTNAFINAVQYMFNIRIAGKVKTFQGQIDTTYLNSLGKTKIGTWSVTVDHNEDGTAKEVSYNCDGQCNLYVYGDTWQGWSWIVASETYTHKALTIPRQSSLSKVVNASSNNIYIPVETDTSVLVEINKYVASYVDKLTISVKDTVVKTIEAITGPHEFNFTADEVTQIQNLMSDTGTADLIFSLASYSDDTYSTQIGTSSVVTCKAQILNANPLFSNFTYEDTDEVTLALTGDNQTIISGYSDLKIIVNRDNKAVAQKGATMSFYQINNDAYSYADDFSHVIENYAKNTILVYAIDSRQYSTLVNKVLTNFIEFKDLIVSSSSYERDGNVSEATKFNFGGTYWGGNFGAVANSISATYRYKETGSNKWINGVTPINITVLTSSENEYSFEGYLQGDVAGGFSADKSFNVEIIVSDKLSSKTISYIVSSGEPAIDIFKSNVSFGKMYDENAGGKIQGIFDVGDLFLTMNSKNPSAKFGGTWELIAQGKTLIGAGTGIDINEIEKIFNAGETGGEYEHILTVDEMPKHVHSNERASIFYAEQTTARNAVGARTELTNSVWKDSRETGGDKAHNNMQPYLVIYIWQRTA